LKYSKVELTAKSRKKSDEEGQLPYVAIYTSTMFAIESASAKLLVYCSEGSPENFSLPAQCSHKLQEAILSLPARN
jgi:hypothetical protein